MMNKEIKNYKLMHKIAYTVKVNFIFLKFIACSIKMLNEYINWTVPEGGGGPNYSGM